MHTLRPRSTSVLNYCILARRKIVWETLRSCDLYIIGTGNHSAHTQVAFTETEFARNCFKDSNLVTGRLLSNKEQYNRLSQYEENDSPLI